MTQQDPAQQQSASAPEEAAAIVVPAPQLPAAPRPRTGGVSRRATWDPRVRFWFFLAGLIAGFSLYLGVKQVSAWSYDRSLVISGSAVDATVVEIAGLQQTNRRAVYSEPIKLRFKLPGGADQTVSGWLREVPAAGNMVSVGQTLPIRYDPDRPSRWTDRKEPPGIGPALVSVYLLVPLSAAMVVVGLYQRSRVLATWEQGRLVAAAVLSASNSAIAPGYSHVVVAPSGTRNENLTVYIPRSDSRAMRGDVVWILVRDNGPALAARAFA
jgi:hypothetical protein